MAEQKFKVGDRVKITDFTGTIVGTKLVDNSIKYICKKKGEKYANRH